MMRKLPAVLFVTALCAGMCVYSGCDGSNPIPRGLLATATPTMSLTSSPTFSPTAIPATPTATEVATASPTATAVPMAEVFRAPAGSEPAGPRNDGTGVLANGRIVAPVGRQTQVETLPLNLRVGPDGHIFVTNDGNGTEELQRYLQVIDPQTLAVQKTPSQHFFGLAVSADRVYVANGPDDRIDVFSFDGAQLQPLPEQSIQLPEKTFPMGIDLTADGKTLYAVGFLSNSFWRIDVEAGTAQEATTKIGNFPYTVAVNADGSRAYVSSWGINNGNPAGLVPAPLPPTDPQASARSSVAVMDTGAAAPALVKYVPIGAPIDNHQVFGGSHPSAMALSPSGAVLYVTATNDDLVDVIDTATNKMVAEIDLNAFGNGLQGLYPDALAVSADGTRLYVADAGLNAVQVIDADETALTFTTAGFIPSGWYPSALGFSGDGKTLYVANAKGLGVGANGGELVDISFETMSDTPYYIGHIIHGTVSAVDLASVDLQAGTAAVRANNGFDPIPVPSPVEASPVPLEFGSGPSQQIQYVVYILKENRTYDQVLGDLEIGNGDPSLTLFGEEVTPNTHALARQFAMGDNFYNDAEVSYPGHEWVTQGNTNDFVEKIWPFEYNNLLGTPFNVESGQEGFCRDGYIFQALDQQGVSHRTYGEPLAFNSRFGAGIDGGGVNSTLTLLIQAFGGVPQLIAHVNDLLNGNIQALRDAGVNVDLLEQQVWPNLRLDYPSNILSSVTDVSRARLFLDDLATYSANGNLPHFLFIWLPNDHTFGALPSSPSPTSAVADNDSGLGMVVDGLTQSPFWPHMAIFVSEDDAQDGQDHVEAHRTLSLVISPYVKHGYVSPVHHSNVSMLKTMELLLGVHPMSQYDRYATDMRDYFTTTPDNTAFTLVPALVRPEKNPSVDQAPNDFLREAAKVSLTLDFDEADHAGSQLSRVLWLVHLGEKQEQRRQVEHGAATALMGLLLLSGATFGWRRHRARA